MDQIDKMVLIIKQNKKCAVCHRPIDTSAALDHCHITGKPRELLCRKCNVGIGMLQDDTTIVFNAFQYLVKHKYGETLNVN